MLQFPFNKLRPQYIISLSSPTTVSELKTHVGDAITHPLMIASSVLYVLGGTIANV